jgi:hypothetical protein
MGEDGKRRGLGDAPNLLGRSRWSSNDQHHLQAECSEGRPQRIGLGMFQIIMGIFNILCCC